VYFVYCDLAAAKAARLSSVSVDPAFGRVSYTQYEALYARQPGKKVWYLFIDETFQIVGGSAP
jgi:hypothetical protein